jgi:hypothetical protein
MNEIHKLPNDAAMFRRQQAVRNLPAPSTVTTNSLELKHRSSAPPSAQESTGVYQCTHPLQMLGGSGAKSGPDIPGNPAYHSYLCIVGDDGVRCDGQTRDHSVGFEYVPYGPGKPSREDDSFDGETCTRLEQSSGCLSGCVAEEFETPRPWYGLLLIGTNCQQWVSSVIETCSRICSRN